MIDETVAEIEGMQTHSSSTVAVKAANALRSLRDVEFPTVEEYLRALERNSDALRRANPSHASLHTTQRRIVDRVTEAEPETIEEAHELTEAAIEALISEVETAKSAAANRCVDRLHGTETLLTHDYSSTVLEAIRTACADDCSFTVYVTEARPRYLGRRMIRELATIDGVEPKLIVDSAAGYYLSDVDQILVGMDCIVDDVLYNRVGTYPIAAAAADAGVPFAVVGAEAKRIDGGFAFQNEFRAAAEVMREPADGFTVENPAYDATPMRLVDAVITDEAAGK
jgi:translation initiation factor eIF-2B subunit delta